ncbi:MAG TPA: HEAT repeat domain-containing protein [Chthoniobacterales bacterium]|nr:HEAT repeat domain-containing protein [Chthoniobacterales bacterium]
MSSALAWFETLGFPDVTNCPYVRVTLGFSDPNIHPAKNTSCDGFLLSDDGKKFTVFFTESIRRGSAFYAEPFDVMTFVRTPKGTPETQSVGYEPISLKGEADKAIRAWRSSLDKESHDYGNYLYDKAGAFALGWSCLHKGLGPQAKAAFAQAWRFHAVGRPSDGTFQEALAEHLVYILADRAVYDFLDPTSRPKPRIGVERPMMSHADLLTIFEKLQKDFPHTALTEPIDKITGTLRLMVREDVGHHPKPLDQMTPQEQVAEWIFRLRDQPGWTYSRPGLCDILPEFRGRPLKGQVPLKYPADHLVELGFSAVPQLIDSLSSTRLSRAIDEGHISTFHRILTVGECARQILRQIAHRDFGGPLDGNPEDWLENDQMIRAWWADAQAKGGDTLLFEGVRKGGWDSMTQARVLQATHPDQASEAIIIGIQHAEREDVRDHLIGLLGQAKDEASAAFLNREMVDDSCSFQTRISAAEALYSRGDEHALPALIAEWQKGTSGSVDSILEAQENLESLAGFLLGSGKPEGVKSVARTLSRFPASTRIKTIILLAHQNAFSGPHRSLSQSEADASNKLVDGMLFAALDDHERYEEFSAMYGGFAVRDPRVCDLAAWKLSERWPEKYPFKWTKSPADMDRQIAAMKTARREDE